MIRFFLTLAILLLPFGICSAEAVQVSDLKVWEFVDLCNYALNKEANNYRMEIVETSPIQIAENAYIAYYCKTIGGVGSIFLANRDGTISKIVIIYNESYSQTASTLLVVCALSIGLSDDETSILFHRDSRTSHSVWCLRSQRQIVVNLERLREPGFYSIEISAYK